MVGLGNLTKRFNAEQTESPQQNMVRKVLFLAPEWGTITKIGGLADVVASLSQALTAETQIEVRTVLLGFGI